MPPIQLIQLTNSIAYPVIGPVDDSRTDSARPLWSVMIPTANDNAYLSRAVQSVLAQDLGEQQLQIEIIDNRHTGADPALTSQWGQRVSVYRQPQRLGMSANWTTCIQRALGQWIVVLHDDDMLLPTFFSTYATFMQTHPKVVMIFSRAISIDENDTQGALLKTPLGQSETGIVQDALAKLTEQNFVAASSVAVRRDVYGAIGGFHPAFTFPVDWEMWIRIAHYGPIAYIHPPQSLRRIHAEAETIRCARLAENSAQIFDTVQLGLKLLPPERRESVKERAMIRYADHALHWCTRFAREGDYDAAKRHARWAWRFAPTAKTAANLASVGCRIIANRFLRSQST